jgi:pimeloyl-ACP methyl ester carboxylesterase
MRILVSICIASVLFCGFAQAKPLSDDDSPACPKDAMCGTLQRPQDPDGRVKGTIGIAYRLYRHRDAAAPCADVIVAQEGGPGFSTFGSASGYLTLFEPLRKDRDVLMIDVRGTGKSRAINCPSVQRSPNRTTADIAACGRALGRAANFYGTRLAAQDLVAVLDTLHIDKIDYYGDSYGTFFGQVFSALYPDRLRSLVLDSAYPVIGETPWYFHAGEVVRQGYEDACKRAPACAALPGTSLDRIRKLVAYLGAHPIRGKAPDGEGHVHAVTVTPAMIGQMLFDGTNGPINHRELDAATRALFDNHDVAPLIRLTSENLANEYPQDTKSFSYGLFAAVSCIDYQQIYDMNAPVTERHAQRDAAVAARKKDFPLTYDPLSFEQFQQVPLDISVLNFCIDWPLAPTPHMPGKPIPDGAKFTDAPTLVLNGELDMLTTAAEGSVVTAQYPHGKQLIVANSFHVVAVDDIDDCAAGIVRRFVETLDPGDTSCAAKVAPVRSVPKFVQHAEDAVPAIDEDSNEATQSDRALASASIQTAADVLARWYVNYGGKGLGLRGGSWSFDQPEHVARYTLKNVRWANDLPVSGSVVWDQRDGSIAADLTFGHSHVIAKWNDREDRGKALLSGNVNGRRLVAAMPAP